MNDEFIVRPAADHDAPTIARLNEIVQGLHHEACPDRFLAPDANRVLPTIERWLAARGTEVGRPDGSETRAWLCESLDETALGYVLAVYIQRPETPFTHAASWVELDQIAVLLDARTRGVGKALTSAVHSWARSLGVSEMQLSVWTFNRTAQEFFASLGFRSLHQRMQMDINPKWDSSER